MNEDIFLYTLPQWIIFAAIISSVYGWVEHKKVFRLLGSIIFFLLGLFALYSLLGGYFDSYEYLTPEELIHEQLEEEQIQEAPIQIMLFPAYISFLLTGVLSIPVFFMELWEKKGKNLLMIFTALVALFGFFIIVGALRNI